MIKSGVQDIVEFDSLPPPNDRMIELRRATLLDIPAGRRMADDHLPGELAPFETIERVIEFNPNNVLLIRREGELIGLWAMLMLSALGLEYLLLGELDVRNPNLSALVPKTAAPAAIYHWAIVGPGIGAEGARQVSRYLRQPLFRYSNLFSRPTTPRGLNFMIGLGFMPIRCSTEGLYRYVRCANPKARTAIAA